MSQDISITSEQKRDISDFVAQYFHSNFYLIGKDNLDSWIIPSLKLIPRVVESVGEK